MRCLERPHLGHPPEGPPRGALSKQCLESPHLGTPPEGPPHPYLRKLKSSLLTLPEIFKFFCEVLPLIKIFRNLLPVSAFRSLLVVQESLQVIAPSFLRPGLSSARLFARVNLGVPVSGYGAPLVAVVCSYCHRPFPLSAPPQCEPFFLPCFSTLLSSPDGPYKILLPQIRSYLRHIKCNVAHMKSCTAHIHDPIWARYDPMWVM